MSLRLRLLLTVAIVVIASIAAVAIVSSSVVRVEVDHLVRNRPEGEANPRQLAKVLSRHYAAHAWNGVDRALRELRDRRARGRELLVLDPRGAIVAASSPLPKDFHVARGNDGMTHLDFRTARGGTGHLVLTAASGNVVRPDGTVVGTLLVLPPWSDPAARAIRNVDRWLLGAVIAIGLLALGSTALLARRMVRPIEELQHAVTRVAAGDFTPSVAIHSRDEVGKLGDAFNAMAGQLARNEVLRRNLLNDVAHELRTPLTDLLCVVESIQDGVRSADANVIASLHDDLMLLKTLVDDLQTLSLAEAGKLPLRRAQMNVAELVRRAVPADARIVIDVPEDLTFDVDPLRFQQIVRNLVQNALVHGGGRVTIRAGASQIMVSGEGEGIAAEHLPHLFDRFYRADASRTRGTGGAGLGLAIVKQLVELHGATIAVESAPGHGTTFTIDIR